MNMCRANLVDIPPVSIEAVVVGIDCEYVGTD
jgi:hypothetical protein